VTGTTTTYISTAPSTFPLRTRQSKHQEFLFPDFCNLAQRRYLSRPPPFFSLPFRGPLSVSLRLFVYLLFFLSFVYYWCLLSFKKSKVRTTLVWFCELVIFFPCRSSTRICNRNRRRAAAAVTREKCTSWTSREERAVSREREREERERVEEEEEKKSSLLL